MGARRTIGHTKAVSSGAAHAAAGKLAPSDFERLKQEATRLFGGQEVGAPLRLHFHTRHSVRFVWLATDSFVAPPNVQWAANGVE